MTDHEQLTGLLTKYAQLVAHTAAQVKDLNENQLLDFVDQRDVIAKEMEPLQSVITDKHRAQIQELLQTEVVILERMQDIKQEASEWLERRGNIRSQQSAYQRSYAIDGTFIDYRN
ncbi:hypothetical protein QUF95_28625 [Paenibacillus silvae]|jgi:hypothetical protein|uniref:hypothetical protein n=1 Tax=Paenibacillus silvae TaxID=1325358 RepID=UPI0025A1336D|nr:hypothetical protein [Paenibacillus silvae]MDM5281332.1 hypothetical protein [Paenibacillus silvae]